MVPGDQFSAIFCRESEQPSIVEQLTIFRKALFVDRCGWRLDVQNGRERDEFDDDDCVHCALFTDGRLVGGFRAIPTTYPYLAHKILGDSTGLQPLPRRADHWEISRFGVLPTKDIRRLSMINYGLMFFLARQVKAAALVALADLSHERFLRTIGVRTRRYGPPQQIGVDLAGNPIHAVVGEIPIAAQSGNRFDALVQAVRNVEVDDASLVFRPTRISA